MPSAIEYILITHFHGDHYFDVPFYILNKSKSSNKKINIFCSSDGKDKIQQIGNLAFPNSFEDACSETTIDYIFNESFVIKNYEVNKLLMDHGRMKSA